MSGREGTGTGRKSVTGKIEEVRSGEENYIVIWLKSVELQSGGKR